MNANEQKSKNQAVKTTTTTATPVTPVVKKTAPVTPVAKTATPVAPVVKKTTPVTPVAKTATPATKRDLSWVIPSALLALALCVIAYLLWPRNATTAQAAVGNNASGNNASNTSVVAPNVGSNSNTETNPIQTSNSSFDSFPSTVAYTVVMQFKDGTELTKTLMTDLDLEDDKETWDRIQKVGIADLIVTNTTPILFFYNGYVMPVSVGENQSLGEIWETAMSNDPEYNSGFALRQLANGCSSLSSTWIDAEGISHTQAQTAVTEELATWLVNYCDAREITEWKNDRASLGMPESLFTK